MLKKTIVLPVILPKSLEKGDLIAIVFPASYLQDHKNAEEILQRKISLLEERGYRVAVYPDKVTPIGYLAGSDDERARALMDAWKNDEVKAIMTFRGGYGSLRILDLLDYEWIKTHPKIFLGMSDITALHIAIRQKTGLITFLAPPLQYFAEMESSFNIEFAFSEMEKTLSRSFLRDIPLEFSDTKIVRPGTARGEFVGGNLSMLAALCGTKWQLDTEDKILLIEDTREKTYRIDRLLWQLKNAHLLRCPKAVILCTFEKCDDSLTEFLTDYFSKASYPVILGFPSGHTDYQTTIPLGIPGEINTSIPKVTILERSVCKSLSPSVCL